MAAGERPASGIAIDPAQLTRIRDAYPMSREQLAERTGEILFDYDRFAEVLAGQRPAEPRLARALWLALDCAPADIIDGLPGDLPVSGTPLWLRGNSTWTVDLDAVARRREQRSVLDGDDIRTWTVADLARAVARHWFSRDSVHKIETPGPKGRRPSHRALQAFCQILGCTRADLMPGSPPLPDGQTQTRREMLAWNRGMREYADARGITYRTPGGRINYDMGGLREQYAAHRAAQEASALAS